jgi:MoaA/NifB/PqqE/SkfB family radical SAM enzyme
MARQSGLKDTLPPLTVDFAVTRRCNLRCRHCYVEATDSPHPEELGSGEAIRLITEVADAGARFIVFDGGEPLLRDDIYQLVNHAYSTGLLPVLNTNGTLLSTEAATRLKNAGLQMLTVGLKGHDGMSHDEFCGIAGSWDRALAGFRNAWTAGIRHQLSICVTRQSSGHVGEFASLAKSLKAEAVEFYRFVPIGRGEDQVSMALTQQDEEQVIDQIIRHHSTSEDLRYRCVALPQLWIAALQSNGKKAISRFEKSPCVAGLYRCSIGYEGSVFPCEFLRKKAGNVRQRTFKEIWQQAEVLKKLRDRDKLEKKCGKCGHQIDCGGARCIALCETGSLTKSTGCSLFSKDAPKEKSSTKETDCSQCGDEATTTCQVCQNDVCTTHSLTCPVCHGYFCSPGVRACIFSHNCEGSQ